MDMSKTIAAKSDQLNSDDLMGGPITIKVAKVFANPDAPDQPVSVSYDGDNGKPYRPCKSMRRVMVACWGADAANYAGRFLTLYRDAEVPFGGMKVGGLRISHMSHIDGDTTVAIMASKGRKKAYPVKLLRLPAAPQEQPAEDGAKKWAESQIEAIGLVDSIDGYEEIVSKGLKAMAKLEGDRPELFKAVTDAYHEAMATLSASPSLDDSAF